MLYFTRRRERSRLVTSKDAMHQVKRMLMASNNVPERRTEHMSKCDNTIRTARRACVHLNSAQSTRDAPFPHGVHLVPLWRTCTGCPLRQPGDAVLQSHGSTRSCRAAGQASAGTRLICCPVPQYCVCGIRDSPEGSVGCIGSGDNRPPVPAIGRRLGWHELPGCEPAQRRFDMGYVHTAKSRHIDSLGTFVRL